MPLLNKAEIESEVKTFRAFCEAGAPTPEIRSDQPVYNDIVIRAFQCGAEWANMPESRDPAKALSDILGAVETGFKRGLEIRQRKAVAARNN